MSEWRRVGKIVRERREELGIGVNELAREVDYAHSSITYLEQGARSWSNDMLRKVAKALEFHPDRLILEAERLPDDVAPLSVDELEMVREQRDD